MGGFRFAVFYPSDNPEKRPFFRFFRGGSPGDKDSVVADYLNRTPVDYYIVLAAEQPQTARPAVNDYRHDLARAHVYLKVAYASEACCVLYAYYFLISHFDYTAIHKHSSGNKYDFMLPVMRNAALKRLLSVFLIH